MSICEKMSFKCTECYQCFLTQADLQCHVYDHHRQREGPVTTGPETNDVVKQEDVTTCVETNGNGKTETVAGEETCEKPTIKVEKHDETDVKTEIHDKDDGEDDEDGNDDEELIDVGVNNRTDEKSPRVVNEADTC